jgi:hypothetical protein
VVAAWESVAAAKNMPDTLETASHGYVVASVEHTGNNDASFQARPFWRDFAHTSGLIQPERRKPDPAALQRRELHH